MNSSIISLLTLVVALLTQVQSTPNLSPAAKLQAITLATSVLEYIDTTQTIVTPEIQTQTVTQGTGEAPASQVVEQNPVTSQEDTPTQPQATTTEITQLPVPNFIGTPQETFTPDEPNNAQFKNFSWETDIPTTAELDLCTGVGFSVCSPRGVFTDASTTGSYSIERPLSASEQYQLIVTANGQSQTFVWNR